MTERRPDADVATQLLSSISAEADVISIVTTSPLNLDTRKLIGGPGGEYVRCTGVQQDPWPALTGCQRGLSVEDGGSPPRSWGGGEMVYEVPWTTIEIVTVIPIPTAAMIGRQFIYRDAEGNSYSFNVAVEQDQTPYIDWINEPPPSEVVTPPGSLVTTITIGTAFASNNPKFPTGICIDGSGNIYAFGAGAGASNIDLTKFSPSLAFQYTKSFGKADNQAHIATDSTYVYAAQNANAAMYKRLASDGNAVANLAGTVGAGDGEFAAGGPQGLATDNTYLYVTDPGNHRVQKLDLLGNYVNKVGGLGSANGLMNGPMGVTVRAGKLYVLDSGNGRVQRFDAATLIWEFTFGTPGSASGQISTTARGIAVDSLGRIWISDTGNHRVQVFDALGVFVTSVGSFGSAPAQLNSPDQIALASDTLAYVTDHGNNVIKPIALTQFITSSAPSAPVAIMQNTDYAGTNVNTPQQLFSTADAPNGTLTVEAGMYDCVIVLRMTCGGTTSSALSLLFAGTASIASLGLFSMGAFASTDVDSGTFRSHWIDAATAHTIFALSGGSAKFEQFLIRGLIRVGTGGTLIPQYQWSVAPGAAPLTKANSYIYLAPVEGNAATKIGAVS